jgi:hypothetical protein
MLFCVDKITGKPARCAADTVGNSSLQQLRPPLNHALQFLREFSHRRHVSQKQAVYPQSNQDGEAFVTT